MGHGPHRTDILHQLDVRCAVGEGIVADHSPHRLATKLTITAGIDMFVEAGLSDFG
ncbi:hypothetical protein D3C76_1178640 [compost metagenome]